MTEQTCDVDGRFSYPAASGNMSAQSNIPSWNPLAIETLDEHAEAMLRFPGMEHDEPYMAHVAPGQSGEMIWTFNRAGEFDFACLIAGHYQAGMVGTIRVSGAPGAKG